MDTRALEAELLAGLEGTTDGPWYWSDGYLCSRSAMITIMRDCRMHNGADADLNHMARCSPDNIRALLRALADERERAERAERERDEAEDWRDEVEALSAEMMEETGQAYCYVGIRDYAAVKERADRLAVLFKDAEEALEPFSKYPLYAFEHDDAHQLTARLSPAGATREAITAGDLRRARSTLAKIKEATDAK